MSKNKSQSANSVHKQYRKNQFKGLHRKDLLVITYNRALEALRQNDISKCRKLLALLISAVNLKGEPVIGYRYLRLYKYCQDMINQQEYGAAENILTGLRDAWKMADIPKQPG